MKDDPLSFKSAETFLGFDYGLKKIGVAVGQLTTMTTSPLETVYAIKQKTNWDKISRLVNIWRPRGLIVGISYQEDGAENVITRPMLRFRRQLEGRYRIPVFLIDETLSTMESKRLLLDGAKVSRKKANQVHDQVAAQLILQTWFSVYSENPIGI